MPAIRIASATCRWAERYRNASMETEWATIVPASCARNACRIALSTWARPKTTVASASRTSMPRGPPQSWAWRIVSIGSLTCPRAPEIEYFTRNPPRPLGPRSPWRPRGEGPDFLLVEDPAELAHRVQQPFRLVRHTPDVPGPDPELLRDFLLRAFGDPVVEEGRRLYLREEEIVVLDGECQVGLLDPLLDPSIVAATEVELRHVRCRADGPEVEEAVVPRFAERIAHLHGAEWIDIEVARALPEKCGFEEAILSVNELLFCKEVEHLEDLAANRVDVAREREERAVEEREEILLRAHMASGDVREDVHSEGGLGSEFGFNRFGFAEEVVLDQFVDIVLVFRKQDGLAVAVVSRAAGSAAHLFDLEDWDGREPQIDIEPVQVSDDDSPCGEVQTTCEGRGCRERFQATFAKLLCIQRSLRVL